MTERSSPACPYKGPFGCKCGPGECKYTHAVAAAGSAKPIGFISADGLRALHNDNDATICCDNSARGFDIPVFRTPDAAQPSRNALIEECARIVEHWSLPTIQTPSMWLVDKAGITAEIRALALTSTDLGGGK